MLPCLKISEEECLVRVPADASGEGVADGVVAGVVAGVPCCEGTLCGGVALGC